MLLSLFLQPQTFCFYFLSAHAFLAVLFSRYRSEFASEKGRGEVFIPTHISFSFPSPFLFIHFSSFFTPYFHSFTLSRSLALSLSLSLSLILFLISFKRFSLLVFFFTLLLLPLSTFCFHSQFFQPVFLSFRHLFSLLYPIFSFYFLYASVVTFAMSLPKASNVETFFMSLLAFSSV